jgi:hypothetical protein
MLNVVHWPCNITKEESSSGEQQSNEWIALLFTDLNIVMAKTGSMGNIY